MRVGAMMGLVMALLAGCARPCCTAPVGDAAGIVTVSVPAAGETVPVATANADAADDPAIFANRQGGDVRFGDKTTPGLILGTDKKAGLYVFALDGSVLQFLPEGRLNNVDLIADADLDPAARDGGFIAGASDRSADRMGVTLYRFRPGGMLKPAGFIPSVSGEPYGFCMGVRDGTPLAVLVMKDGTVVQYALKEDGDTITGTEEKRYAIGSQSEGCVVDSIRNQLYVGEEDVGIWRYSTDPADTARLQVAPVGDGRLVADVEGMSLIADDEAQYLVVSSQGDSAFAVFRLNDDAAPTFAGRFRVVPANGVDGVSGTDGVAAFTGPIGRFKSGLVVTQDDDNDGQAQNFKLIDWAAVRTALKLH